MPLEEQTPQARVRARYITKADVYKYGTTDFCPGCVLVAVRQSTRVVRSQVCRDRIAELMDQDDVGRARLAVHASKRPSAEAAGVLGESLDAHPRRLAGGTSVRVRGASSRSSSCSRVQARERRRKRCWIAPSATARSRPSRRGLRLVSFPMPRRCGPVSGSQFRLRRTKAARNAAAGGCRLPGRPSGRPRLLSRSSLGRDTTPTSSSTNGDARPADSGPPFRVPKNVSSLCDRSSRWASECRPTLGTNSTSTTTRLASGRC